MVLQLQAQAFLLLQERAVSFDILAMWGNMQWPARTIVITLIIMSAWSIGVMIDRCIAFNGARKQSRPSRRPWPERCARASWMKRSRSPTGTGRATWLKSWWPVLQEFRAHQMSSDISGEEIEASNAPSNGPSYRARRAEAWRLDPGNHRVLVPLRGIVGNGGRHHQRV